MIKKKIYNEWISINDRLPELGTEVIVKIIPGNLVTALTRYVRAENSVDYYWDNNYPGYGNLYFPERITHWQPMPLTSNHKVIVYD